MKASVKKAYLQSEKHKTVQTQPAADSDALNSLDILPFLNAVTIAELRKGVTRVPNESSRHITSTLSVYRVENEFNKSTYLVVHCLHRLHQKGCFHSLKAHLVISNLCHWKIMLKRRLCFSTITIRAFSLPIYSVLCESYERLKLLRIKGKIHGNNGCQCWEFSKA